MREFRVRGSFEFVVLAEDYDDARLTVEVLADHDLPHVQSVTNIEVFTVVEVGGESTVTERTDNGPA